MRELTFKGFLSKYLKNLSKNKTLSINKLVKEAKKNLRIKEPLLLYALYSGKGDLLLTAAKDGPFYNEYKNLLSKYGEEDFMKASEENSQELPREYLKVRNSYLSQKNRHRGDDETKELMRKKIKRLQKAHGVTNYRIYADLKLNPGNFNAWIKNGTEDKISLKTARTVLEYMEKSCTQI